MHNKIKYCACIFCLQYIEYQNVIYNYGPIFNTKIKYIEIVYCVNFAFDEL